MTPISKVKQLSKQRLVLVNRRTLLTLSFVTLALLWLLKPNDSLLLSLLEQSEDPTVALAFMNVLKKTENNTKVDMVLARHQYRLGNASQALQNLLPLTKFNDTPQWRDAQMLYATLLLALSNKDHLAKQQLIDYLQQPPQSLSEDDKLQLANFAMQIGQPAIALHIQKRLPNQSAAALLVLALQAEQPAEALLQAQRIYISQPNSANLLQMLNLLENQQQTEKALILAQQHIKQHGCASACLQALVALALRNDNAMQAALIASIKAEQSMQAADLLQASQLHEATANLPMATRYLELLLLQEPMLVHKKKLHQYYRWQQQTDKALALSQQMIELSTAQPILLRAIEDANAQSDITALADFYFLLAQQQGLNPTQLMEWVDANDKAYGAQDTVSKLLRLLRLQPHQHRLKTQLARFYNFIGKPELTAELWPQLATKSSLTYQEANWFAQAFISIGQPQQALQLLHHYSEVEPLNNQQLSMMLDLARYNADADLQRYYIQKLLHNGDVTIDTFLAVALHSEMSDADLHFLWQLYQQGHALNILAAIINHAIEQQNDALLNQAKAQLSLNHADVQRLEVKQLRIRIALYQQDYVTAKTLLKRIITRPFFPSDALLNAGWLALMTDDQQWLAQLYPALRKLNTEQTLHLRLIAATAERLGYQQQAMYWHQRIATRPDVNAVDKLNHALLAEHSGDLALAQQLRWQVIRTLSHQLKLDAEAELSYQSLVAALLSPASAAATLTSKMQQAPNSAILSLLHQGPLAHNLSSLQYWQLRLLLQNAQLSDSLSLMLALAQQDTHTVKALTSAANRLTPFEKANALFEIGEHAAAWYLAEHYLTAALAVGQRAPLQRFLTTLHPMRSHGIRVEWKQYQSWDLDSWTLDYYQPYRDGQFRLGLQRTEANALGPLLSGYQQQSATLRWMGPLQHNDLQLDLSWQLRERLGQFQQGQQVTARWQSVPRLNHSLRLRHQMPSEQSENLFLLGHEHRLEWQPQWQATAHTQLSSTVAYSQFATDFNEPIASQWQWQLQLSEQLSRSPFWRLYSQFDWQQNTLKQTDFSQLTSYTGNSFTALDFLTERYQRLSIGQQLARGQVGEPGPQMPHYRYWLDTAVGYNLITSNVDYSINVGFGLRILGNDELFIKTNWQSADRVGRENFSLSLGYFVDF